MFGHRKNRPLAARPISMTINQGENLDVANCIMNAEKISNTPKEKKKKSILI